MQISNPLVAQHHQSGRFFEVAGVKAFVREEGTGDPIVCLHGVPSSSFLYRKLLPALADGGLRAIAFDFPGMGLSDRPESFDYSWTGLGEWSVQATEALGLDSFHLVVHDIGGPVGFEMIAAQPERIKSLTILNTILVGVGSFSKPMVMRPFEWKGAGELYLKTLIPAAFQQLMYLQGVQQKAEFGYAEAAAYVELLKREDKGRAFLKIMRNFEPTPKKEQRYRTAVQQLQVPKQVIWGEKDTALTVKKYGMPIHKELGIDRIFTVSGKHFLQEDCYTEITERILEMV